MYILFYILWVLLTLITSIYTYIRDQSSVILLLPINLLIILNIQEFLSDYYAVYVQFCMSSSLHVADSFIQTVLLECINERYQSILLCSIIQ